MLTGLILFSCKSNKVLRDVLVWISMLSRRSHFKKAACHLILVIENVCICDYQGLDCGNKVGMVAANAHKISFRGDINF